MGADAVFISYSHDSPEHSARVLAFSDKLRELGVDAELDQYHTRPAQGWPLWCEECLRPENAKHVLMICTPTYRKRVENRVPADEGRGVFWEGSVVYQHIYKEKANERFIPVLFGDGSDESVPMRMQGYATFRVKTFDLSDAGFEALYRELTGQPAIIKPGLGAKVVLSAKAIPVPIVAAPLPEKPGLTTFETAAPPVDISRIDRYAPAQLIGRDGETKLIEAPGPRLSRARRSARGSWRSSRSAAKARPRSSRNGRSAWRKKAGRTPRRRSPDRSTARGRASSKPALPIFFSPKRSSSSARRRSRAKARTTKAAVSPPVSAPSAPRSSSTASSRCNIPQPHRSPGN